MKKWFAFILVLCVASFVRAQGMGQGGAGHPRMGEGGDAVPPSSMQEGRRMPPPSSTKEQFVERQKKMAERKGEEFDPAAAGAKFDELDKNKDGVLSRDEMRPGPNGPLGKEQFVERQKKMAERKGEDFDQADAEAKFDEMDKNKDGMRTGNELPMAKRQHRQGRADDGDDQGQEDDD